MLVINTIPAKFSFHTISTFFYLHLFRASHMCACDLCADEQYRQNSLSLLSLSLAQILTFFTCAFFLHRTRAHVTLHATRCVSNSHTIFFQRRFFFSFSMFLSSCYTSHACAGSLCADAHCLLQISKFLFISQLSLSMHIFFFHVARPLLCTRARHSC